MIKIILLIIISLLSKSIFSQTGINTKDPTATLDVNGDVRIREIPIETSNYQILCADLDGFLSKMEVENFSATYIIGDIKDGLENKDHNGWYLLDGRLISTLPEKAKNNAINLGFIEELPDFINKMTKSKSETETIGDVGGSPTAVITKNHLPSFQIKGKTNYAGNHTHSLQQKTNHLGTGLTLDTKNRGAKFGTFRTNRNTSLTGNHTHKSLTLKSNGGNEPIKLEPTYISLKSFVYLGK